ncbi:MAG: quercetin dioxygenase-like cupin family protein [Kiritimatiellia bacterium]|jgi:quercetin dioxygenase-like cupin family protein
MTLFARRSSTQLLTFFALVGFGCTPAAEDVDTPVDCVADAAGLAGVAKTQASLTFDKPFGPDAPVQMATVVGDRATGAHGTIGIFGPGFNSGPHTHTGAYHGVVLQGRISNPFGTETDAPELGPGSYWLVPAGEQHATVCVSSDEDCIFYFHADDAFDFTPIDELTDAPSSEAKAIDAASFEFEEVAPFVSMAGAWGDRNSGSHGTFGRFPGNATSPVHVHSSEYTGVVISGTVINPFADGVETALSTGGSWQVPVNSEHRTACTSGEDCLFYFHSSAAFDFMPVCEE